MSAYDKSWNGLASKPSDEVEEGLGDFLGNHDRVHGVKHNTGVERVPPKRWWEDLWGLVEIFALIPQWVGLAVLVISGLILAAVCAGIAIAISPLAWLAVKVRHWLQRSQS